MVHITAAGLQAGTGFKVGETVTILGADLGGATQQTTQSLQLVLLVLVLSHIQIQRSLVIVVLVAVLHLILLKQEPHTP